MHRIIVVIAAIMILFGSIVASQALEKQNPTGPEGGGVPGQPTTTAPKKPTTTVPKKPTTTAPVKSDDCSLPPNASCPPNAASCSFETITQCCTAPAGNQKCGPVQASPTPTSCFSGYYGPNCLKCGVCGPNGRCLDGIGGNGACLCNVNYYGPTCGTYCLAATSCSGNGTCSAENGACTCNAGYSGATCNTKSPE